MSTGPVGRSGPSVEMPRVEVESTPAAPEAKPAARNGWLKDRFDQANQVRTQAPTPPQPPTANPAPARTYSASEMLRLGGSVPVEPRILSGAAIDRVVRDAYRSVLLREPDKEGSAAHGARLAELARGGASAEKLEAELEQILKASPEAQVVAAVNHEFKSQLDRLPEQQGYWHERARQWQSEGASIPQIHERMAAALNASPERALNNPAEYLDRVYQRLLGRTADGEGIRTHGAKMKAMNEAGVPFENIAQTIASDIMASGEYAALQASAAARTSTAPSSGDAELAATINRELANTGLAGKGETIVAAARRERVPPELLMSMLQKESSFLSKENNLSIANNNPGNLRFAEWETKFGGKPGGPGNFTTFPSVDKGIEAMAALLGGPVYRSFVDARDWTGLVNKYCPAFDQPGGQADTDLYVKQMKDWTSSWQQKLGVDSNWIDTAAPVTSAAEPAPSVAQPGRELRGITPSQANATGFFDQWSLCGPIAAVAAGRALGKDISIEQARAAGLAGGNYAPGAGMMGAESQVRMMGDLGIAAHTESPVDWVKVKGQLAEGKPVIISTPNHYFVVEGFNAATGKFDCGNSALAMKASYGQQELSPSDIERIGGGAATAIVLDAKGSSAAPPPVASAPAASASTIAGAEEAIAYARNPGVNPNTGTNDWAYWCLGLVNKAYGGGTGGMLRKESATDSFNAYNNAGRISTEGNPPRGALVFFDFVDRQGNNYGHVGISLGDGTYIGTTTDGTNTGVRKIEGGGLPYKGWAAP